MRRRTILIAIALALSVTTMTTMTGCVSEEQVQQAREAADTVVSETQLLITEARAERDEARTRLETAVSERDAARAAGDDAASDAAQARADGNQSFIDVIDSKLPAIESALAVAIETRNSLDSYSSGGVAGFIDSVGSTILPFLPPGAQGPGVAILGVGGLLARLFQKSKALNSLAESTVRLAREDSGVASAIKTNAEMLRRTQTKTAGRAINAAAGNGIRLPF